MSPIAAPISPGRAVASTLLHWNAILAEQQPAGPLLWLLLLLLLPAALLLLPCLGWLSPILVLPWTAAEQ